MAFCRWILIAGFLVSCSVFGLSVTNYAEISSACDGGKFAIRHFQYNGHETLLVVDPQTLKTSIVSAATLQCHPHTIDEMTSEDKAPYFWALEKFTRDPRNIDADYGFDSFNPGCHRMVMSSDLCPSSSGKVFQKEFFLKLANLFGKDPTPISISASGRWLRDHIEDVEWLKQQSKLSITFVNHSDRHIYHPGLAKEQNFMTTESLAQFKSDVIDAEITMIELGLTPSVFFRFPGLMSTRMEVNELRDLGLIPIGTTAWIALDGDMHTNGYKNYGIPDDQKPEIGRIILTHANGNERRGIAKAMAYLDTLKDNSQFSSPEQAVICDYGIQWAAKK